MRDPRFLARRGVHAQADIASIAVGTTSVIERMFTRSLRSNPPDRSQLLSWTTGLFRGARANHGRGGHCGSDAGTGPQRHRRHRNRSGLWGMGARRGTISSSASTNSRGLSFGAGRPGRASGCIGRDRHHAVIDARAEIGPGCRIGAFVSIGVILGRDCRIGSHASLNQAVVGAGVHIYPGATVGQEGFRFATTRTGFRSNPQLGPIIVEDDAEVGANATIHRGSIRDAVIRVGTRIENLAQTGMPGLVDGAPIVAQGGIAGSTIVKDFVQLGGKAAIAGCEKIARHRPNLNRKSFTDNQMTLRFPPAPMRARGLRTLATPRTIARALAKLTRRSSAIRLIWARGAQKYLATINSGHLDARADAVRDLQFPGDGAGSRSSPGNLFELAVNGVDGEAAVVNRTAKSDAIEFLNQTLADAGRIVPPAQRANSFRVNGEFWWQRRCGAPICRQRRFSAWVDPYLAYATSSPFGPANMKSIPVRTVRIAGLQEE